MSTSSFAKNVVNVCLRIGKGDKVLIFTWRHMLDLAEAFAIECRRAGAQTHTEFGTDEMFYDQMINLPVEQIRAPDPFDLALLDIATANIFISGPEDPERLKKVPSERWIEMSRSDKTFYEKLLNKKIRTAQIGLGYITPQRAKTYGFNYEEWKKNVNAALDVNYDDMKRLGEKLGAALEKAREVHITAAKGTDLTFTLENRPVHIYDGVVDEKDIEKGAIFSSLPSGSVHLAPTETSAKGAIATDVPEASTGLLVHGIKWIFKDGKLVSFEGGKNIEALKSPWEKATGHRDRIGWFALGINPKAKLGFINNPIVLGTATVGIGDNMDLGGSNKSDYNCQMTVLQPTVELDGKPVIKQGKLTI